MVQKMYWKMSYLSCDNKTHDITNLVVHRVCLEAQENYYLKNEFLVKTQTFSKSSTLN